MARAITGKAHPSQVILVGGDREGGSVCKTVE
jgi:hypothetical protein